MKKEFIKRLIELREEKGVSARAMSLDTGYNAGWISNIESGKSLPSLEGVFNIADYLRIEPFELFRNESVISLEGLTPQEQEVIKTLIQIFKNQV